jgi:hypothetical protein
MASTVKMYADRGGITTFALLASSIISVAGNNSLRIMAG